MTSIEITQEAYDAIKELRLPPGRKALRKPQQGRSGGIIVWLPPPAMAVLEAARGERESYSDTIIRLVKGKANGRS